MGKRQSDGDETWNRLLNWTKGQKPSERLSAHILSSEGFKSLDPSHLLGGKDRIERYCFSQRESSMDWCSIFSKRPKKIHGNKEKIFR